jgi:catechol 2,3-dioxygenase-like lactoylglutathione lyase family enzyme
MRIERVSAVTLFVTDMARSCAFYRALGFAQKFGGDDAGFTSFFAGEGFLNLSREQEPRPGWGRAIFHVDDVDVVHAAALAGGLTPDFAPRDAAWGERYFHIRDPDDHEISFATPLPGGPY